MQAHAPCTRMPMDAVGKTEIRPLDSSHLEEAAVLLGKLNPDTPVHLVHERLASILAEHPHYQIIGAFDGSRLVGVCGAWVATKIWCGRYLEIDNLVVDPDCRSGGVGTQLMLYLEETARKKKLQPARAGQLYRQPPVASALPPPRIRNLGVSFRQTHR